MLRECLFAITIFALTNGALFADEVVINNGNHLTGTIVKLDSEKLTLQTDFADAVNIKWDAVASLTTDKPIVLQTATGKLNAVSVVRTGSNLQVNSPDA